MAAQEFFTLIFLTFAGSAVADVALCTLAIKVIHLLINTTYSLCRPTALAVVLGTASASVLWPTAFVKLLEGAPSLSQLCYYLLEHSLLKCIIAILLSFPLYARILSRKYIPKFLRALCHATFCAQNLACGVVAHFSNLACTGLRKQWIISRQKGRKMFLHAADLFLAKSKTVAASTFVHIFDMSGVCLKGHDHQMRYLRWRKSILFSKFLQYMHKVHNFITFIPRKLCALAGLIHTY